MPRTLIDTSPYTASFNDTDPISGGVVNLIGSILQGNQNRMALQNEMNQRNREFGLQERHLGIQEANQKSLQSFHQGEIERQRARDAALGNHYTAIENLQRAKIKGLGDLPQIEPTTTEEVYDKAADKFKKVTRPKTKDEIQKEIEAWRTAQDLIAPIRTAGQLRSGINPTNGEPLGEGNPYRIPNPADEAAQAAIGSEPAANVPRGTSPAEQAAAVALGGGSPAPQLPTQPTLGSGVQVGEEIPANLPPAIQSQFESPANQAALKALGGEPTTTDPVEFHVQKVQQFFRTGDTANVKAWLMRLKAENPDTYQAVTARLKAAENAGK